MTCLKSLRLTPPAFPRSKRSPARCSIASISISAFRIVGFAVAVARRGRAAADIAERAQTVADGRRLFAGQGRRRHVESAESVEQDLDAVSCCARPGCLLLLRVRVERVELLNRQVDVLVAADDHAAQRRPAARQVRRHRLEIRRAIRRPLPRRDESTSDAPGQAVGSARRPHSRMVGTSRRAARPSSIVTPVGAAAVPGVELRNDQRHAQRRLVGEDPVRQLAVVAEALAVVGGDDDERLATGGCESRSNSGPSA